MTDEDLVAKKLAFIETCLHELHSVIRPEEVLQDLKSRRFAEHTLQLAIQASLDAASHIVSDSRLGEPRTNKELFDFLATGGWITKDLAQALRRMAGFRNIIVHGYLDVDPQILEDVIRNHTGDLVAFVSAIRARMVPGA